jgi:hypothetical protein
VRHGVTAVTPIDPGRTAYRDAFGQGRRIARPGIRRARRRPPAGGA